MLHEFGDLSFPLPRATNMDNEDEMKENKDLVLYMLKKARVEAANRESIWDYHISSSGPAHLAVHHYHECDVLLSYDADGRRRVALEPTSKHPDVVQAGRGGRGRKYKQPMPNRPQRGAGLDDGIEAGKYRWTGPDYINHQPIVAAGMQPPRPRSQTAAAASILLGHTPSGDGGSGGGGGSGRSATPASSSSSSRGTRSSQTPQDRAAAFERRAAAHWASPGDNRRSDPAAIRGRGAFVTDFCQEVGFYERTTQHARACCGNISWQLGKMNRHGLAGRMTGTCSKKGGCDFPTALVYESSARQPANPDDTGHSAMNFVANQFHSAALGTTKALEESTSSYLSACFLLPPPQTEVFSFIKNKVAPVVAARVAQEEEQVAAEVKANNDAAYTCFDAAHHSQRNAQQSAAALGEMNVRKMLTVVVDCEGPSEQREAKMLVAVNAHCDKLEVDQARCNKPCYFLPPFPYTQHHAIYEKLC